MARASTILSYLIAPLALDPIAGVLTTSVVNLIFGMFLDPIGNMLNSLSLVSV